MSSCLSEDRARFGQMSEATGDLNRAVSDRPVHAMAHGHVFDVEVWKVQDAVDKAVLDLAQRGRAHVLAVPEDLQRLERPEAADLLDEIVLLRLVLYQIRLEEELTYDAAVVHRNSELD